MFAADVCARQEGKEDVVCKKMAERCEKADVNDREGERAQQAEGGSLGVELSGSEDSLLLVSRVHAGCGAGCWVLGGRAHMRRWALPDKQRHFSSRARPTLVHPCAVRALVRWPLPMTYAPRPARQTPKRDSRIRPVWTLATELPRAPRPMGHRPPAPPLSRSAADALSCLRLILEMIAWSSVRA